MENMDLTQKNDNDMARSPERSAKSDTELGSPNQTGPLSERQTETPGSIEGREEKAHEISASLNEIRDMEPRVIFNTEKDEITPEKFVPPQPEKFPRH